MFFGLKKNMKKNIKESIIEPPIGLINIAIENITSNNLHGLKSCIDKMISEYKNGSTSWLFLGIYYNIINELDKAEEAIKKSLKLNENYGEAYRIFADVLRKKQNFTDGLEKAKKAAEINPNNASALDTLGTAYASINDHINAEFYFKKALGINNELSVIHNNLGNTYRHLGKNKESILHLEKAINLDPNIAEIYNNLAITYFEEKNYEKALKTLEKINNTELLDHNNLVNLYTSYGHIFSKMYKYTEAKQYYKKALDLDQENSSANNGLAEIYCIFQDPEKAIKFFRNSIDKSPKIQNNISNYILCYNYLLERDEKEKFEETLKYANLVDQEIIKQKINGLKKNKTINIGFVSGDFYNHPVSYFIESPLKFLKEKDYIIYAYNNNNYTDSYTSELKKYFHNWRDIYHLNDEQIIETIRNDEIDILFDLSGHTAHNSLSVFQRKPAPIQISWLGYSKTTGLKTIDYILTDNISIPKNEEHRFTEKPLRMENSYYCFSNFTIDKNIEVEESKYNDFIFGCFNNTKKLNKNVLRIWSCILRDIPKSKIILKFKYYECNELRKKITEFFIKNSIDENRLIFFNQSPRNEYLKYYNKIDLSLDPFPYPGGTTTCESLFMGVPVLTMKGCDSLSRNSENILINCGLSDFIAKNEEEYINLAKSLAKKGKFAEKNKIKTKFLSSNLLNGELFANELDKNIKIIWNEYCKNKQMIS